MSRGIKLVLATSLAVVALGGPGASGGIGPDPRLGDDQLGSSRGIAYVSDSETAVAPAFPAPLAACPDAPGALRIAGGGFGLTGGTDTSHVVAASVPQDLEAAYGDPDTQRDDYWRFATGVSAGTTATSYAICADWDELKYRTTEVPSADSGARKAKTKCDAGRLTGGGGSIGPSNSYLSSLFPKPGKTWRLQVFDTTDGIGGMQIYRICIKGQDLEIKTAKQSVTGGTSGEVVAKCGQTRSVVGGGAKSSGGPGAMSLRQSHPVDLGDVGTVPDDGWIARTRNLDTGVQSITAYAICFKP